MDAIVENLCRLERLQNHLGRSFPEIFALYLQQCQGSLADAAKQLYGDLYVRPVLTAAYSQQNVN